MNILLIRHGKTSGNLQRKYVGRTDEPLCEEGEKELRQKFQEKLINADEIGDFLRKVQKQEKVPLFVSPMLRCIQTMEIMSQILELKNSLPMIVTNLREMDFGKFEYKNYEELKTEPEYQTYIDTNGASGFPEGEELSAFKSRCIDSFQAILDKYKAENVCNAIGVVHGGTIMTLMEAFAPQKKDFFAWQVENGEGFLLKFR